MSSFSINGKLVTAEDAKISVLDRGVLYGDGIFEGIRMYNRAVFKLDEHLDRLYKSAEYINMKIDIPLEQFRHEVLETAAKCSHEHAYVRITVTRSGTIGLQTTDDLKINRAVIVTPLNYQKPEAYEKGLRLLNVSLIRTPNTALPMRAKTLNYLNSILSATEAKKKGGDDAIMINSDGYVAESSGSNIFFIKGNTLTTPSVDAGILVGVTRNCVIQLAKDLGMEVQERLFKQDEIETAEEIFLTGTAMEIMPVYKINDTLIGTGKVGEKTKKIMESYKKHILEVPGYPV